MPTISTFFGIVIRMYYDDHGPPHFHAYYGEDMALIAVETLEVLSGAIATAGNFVGIGMGATASKRIAR